MGEPETIYEQFEAMAGVWGSQSLLEYRGESWSYEETIAAVERRATFLHDLGIGSDSRVGVLMPNHPEFVHILFATMRVGATFVPFDFRQEGSVLEYFLADSDLSALVVDASVVQQYHDVRESTDVDRVFVLDDTEDNVEHDYDDYGEAVSAANSVRAPGPADVEPTDVAILSYTSGTTGPPKGVENTHRSYVDGGRRIAAACRTDETDRGLLVLPLFHANPMTYGLMHVLAVGGSVVLVRDFSASGFFETARATESTFVTHVGSVLEILQRRIDDGDIDPTSPLEFAVGGAAQFTRQRAFEERTGIQLVRLYGLSEVGGGMVSIAPYRPDSVHGATHQGRFDDQPFDVRILADDGLSFADDGERGEIVVRPDRPGLVFRGYRGKPVETVDAWQDLWMHTGDVGEIRDGRLHYVGRAKTTIRSMGENVSPWEIESVLGDWDRVEDVVAVGVDDDVAGEVVGLWVVAADDDLTGGEVFERCRDRLPEHRWPQYIGFVDSVPRTSTHKVERTSLQARSFDDGWDAADQ